MKPVQIVLALLVVCWWGDAVSQTDRTWNRELEFGVSKTFDSPGFARFHAGMLTPGKKENHWRRLSLDLANNFYQGYYYRNSSGLELTQDSGLIQQLNLTYGMELRTLRSKDFALYAGWEAGIGYQWGSRTTSVFPEGNLNDAPTIERVQQRGFGLLANPYIGFTAMLSDQIGFFCQAWLFTSLFLENTSGSSTFALNQSPELRLGMNLRLGGN